VAVLSDASKKAAYDRDVVVVFPSESDLAKTFQAMDDLLDEMDGLVESMKQFLSRIKQVTYSLPASSSSLPISWSERCPFF
jgi:hypothetical protein